MNNQPGSRIINLYVAKLDNSSTITCVPRLDPDDSRFQVNLPRINQRPLKHDLWQAHDRKRDN